VRKKFLASIVTMAAAAATVTTHHDPWNSNAAHQFGLRSCHDKTFCISGLLVPFVLLALIVVSSASKTSKTVKWMATAFERIASRASRPMDFG
jgi:hypothetical protein